MQRLATSWWTATERLALLIAATPDVPIVIPISHYCAPTLQTTLAPRRRNASGIATALKPGMAQKRASSPTSMSCFEAHGGAPPVTHLQPLLTSREKPPAIAPPIM